MMSMAISCRTSTTVSFYLRILNLWLKTLNYLPLHPGLPELIVRTHPFKSKSEIISNQLVVCKKLIFFLTRSIFDFSDITRLELEVGTALLIRVNHPDQFPQDLISPQILVLQEAASMLAALKVYFLTISYNYFSRWISFCNINPLI